MKNWIVAFTMIIGLGTGANTAVADDAVKSILVDMTHTERWNHFADKLMELHKATLSQYKIRTTEEIGGYYRQPKFFKDVRYFDADSDRLISRVQWERKHPDLVHNMEVYFYDDKGRIVRDFGVAYLTDGRNAPMQTMINFHAYPDGLHAFRQFDASNNLVYERCEGEYKGQKVYISLSEMDILEIEDLPKSVMTSTEYRACFGELPKSAGKYLTPQ